MDQRYAAEFVDVESMSEDEQVLLSETPTRSRRMSFSKAALFSAVLIGFVIAGIFAVSMRRGASKTRTSQVISFYDDLSDLLSGDAAKQVDEEMDELGSSTEEATASEVPVEETTEDSITEEATASEVPVEENTEEPTTEEATASEVPDEETTGNAITEEATASEVPVEETTGNSITEASEEAAEEAWKRLQGPQDASSTADYFPEATTTVEVLTTVEPITPAAMTITTDTEATPAEAITPAATTIATATEATPGSGLSSSELQNIALELQQQAYGLDPSSAQYKQLMNISKMITIIPKASAVPAVAPTLVPSMTTPSPAGSALAPHETIGDGNPCPDNEELSGGLCFKKCVDLTAGTHPIRTSAFSCCRSQPCGVSNTQTNMGMCWGFDVAADTQASRCPHSPGACLTNEEEFDDMCYKKCSDLTGGAYPHRCAPMTCGKGTGWGCFLPTNLKTDPSFALGGGGGDGNAGTPAEAHLPLTALTR